MYFDALGCHRVSWVPWGDGAALLKTETDLSHRKGPKRIFGHRKGFLFAYMCLFNICSRTSDIIMILIST